MDREKHRRISKKYRHLRVKLLKERAGGKCLICGYADSYASLDFHHLRDKKFQINTSFVMCYPMEVLEEEIKKCVLICRNCHNETHHPALSKNPASTMAKIAQLPEALKSIESPQKEFNL